jgi:hypothetical protein
VKKYLVIALAALFVLGFAASSFAIHAEIPAETQAVVAQSATQITIGGELRVRGIYQENTTDFNSKATSSTGDAAKYDERVRLQVEAKVTPNTTGLIQLEAGADTGVSQDLSTWGPSLSGATGTLPFSNQKQNSMKVLQAWILHQGSGLLSVPALVKVGHMPIQIGMYGLFYEHTKFGDDAILLGVDPIKGMHLILGTVKLYEGQLGLNDDVTAYTFIGTYDPNKDTSVGLDVTYADGQNLLQNTILGFTPTFGGRVNDTDLHLWNFAVHGKTRVAGLGIAGELDVQSVKWDDLAPASLPVRQQDDKYTTMAAKVDFDYKINPVTLMLRGAYGSGNNNVTGLGIKKDFVTSQSFLQHDTFVYEYLTMNAAGNFNGGGLQNTMYLKAAASADITKDLDGTLSAYYLRAINSYQKEFNAIGNNINSKSIGTEVDWIVNYKIDRNLKYYVEGGYLFAGNFWRGVTPTTDALGLNHKNPDDAWAIRHGIQLSF